MRCHRSLTPILGLMAAGLVGCTGDTDPDTGDSAADPVSVSLTPEAPLTTDELVAVAEGVDDAASLSWTWYLDNQQVDDLDSLVPAALTARGDVWRVVLTPDQPGGPDASVSAKITIGNSAPEILSLAIDGSPDTAANVTALVESDDADGDAVTLLWSWWVDGDEQVGVTGSALPAGTAARGQQVEVRIAPTDGDLDGETATAEVTIANSPPSIALATVGVSTAPASATLEVQVTGWYDADEDPEQLLYAWSVDGVGVDGDGPTFSLSGQLPDSVVSCQVTPTDGIDEGWPVQTELVVVVAD